MLFPPGSHITYFGCTNFRRRGRLFGIKRHDRLSHIYVIGKTGAGKSTLLRNFAHQDIENGEGLTLLDYHGQLADQVAAHIPHHRRNDVIYFNPTEDTPYGYNPLRRVAPDRRALAASGLLDVFHTQWGERAWGQRMEYIFRNVLLTLLDQPEDMTLLDVLRLLRDDAFRTRVAQNVRHKPVRDFWITEFPKYRNRSEALAPIQSKVSAFLADPKLCTILTKPQVPLSFRRIMDEGKILLVNLSVGRLGTDTASLLGGILITALGLAALSRADTPEHTRRHHWIYADEFQNTVTRSVIGLYPQLRKFKCGLFAAHQYIHQLDEGVRHAILGNTGTLISFRLGGHDAPFIGKEFEPVFEPKDFMALPNYAVYVKMLIDGAPAKPFSAITLPARSPTH